MLKLIATFIHHSFIFLLSKAGVILPKAHSMVIVGSDSTERLCENIASYGFDRVAIITDKPLVEIGLVDKLVKHLEAQGLSVDIFDGVLPDPTLKLIQEGTQFVREHSSQALVAMGGGSSIDSAKVIACLVTNRTDPQSLVGMFKVKEPPLPLFAIPTTSGTGSEATIGAVVSDTHSHEKSIIIDHKMMPLAAALDPTLLTGLPPAITAATGMDALTHAIEVAICIAPNPRVEAYAEHAIKLIFDYLPKAYEDGSDVNAREKMALAAYYAGLAINEVNVGNVHAIAHQLGGTYGVPHGLANAMVLPHVLRFSRQAAQAKLAKLARLVDLGDAGDDEAQLSQKFIDAIEALNQRIGIPAKLDKIKLEDIDKLSWAAVKEGFGYGVPAVMLPSDCRKILLQMS